MTIQNSAAFKQNQQQEALKARQARRRKRQEAEEGTITAIKRLERKITIHNEHRARSRDMQANTHAGAITQQ